MIGAYFDAAITQVRERAKVLKGKIRSPLPSSELTGLQSRCENRLDAIIQKLDYLLSDPLLKQSTVVPIRIRMYRRALEELAQLECTGITALSRPEKEDVFMNKLVFQIHKEIVYPLNPPAVCCLSQEYFVIDPSIGLLSVPLAESDFLLHMPDLYHELAHPIITVSDNPKAEGFQKEFAKFLGVISEYFKKEKLDNLRSTGPKEYFGFVLDILNHTWSIYWSRELFCDLFATYTMGPAYAWSHLHLSASVDADPFDAKVMQVTKHPPDQARMEAVLAALDLLGFTKEKKVISTRWNDLLLHIGAKQNSEYRRACPKELLEQAAVHAFEGTKAIGCRLADIKTSGEIHSILNEAWDVFWKNPSKYHDWEKEKIKQLREKYSS